MNLSRNQETTTDIINEIRRDITPYSAKVAVELEKQTIGDRVLLRDAATCLRDDDHYIKELADRIEAAVKREEEHEGDTIEQIVRDAIVSYQEMFPHAPNDDAERELIERAKRGNDWLVRHGYAQENCVWNKEEEPCL